MARVRDPRQARLLTVASLRWVVRHRAWTWWHLVRYLRFARFRLRYPRVVTEGLVFLGRGVTVYARPGYGRIVLGRFVHLGDGTALRAHEGTLRLGERCVLGQHDTVNCYLDIEIGARSLIADSVYVCDFDHRYADPDRPIKDQGIVKAPVRIGPDVWIGVKASVLRGVVVGAGSVVGAHALVNRDVPPYTVAAGVPARVVGTRPPAPRPLRLAALQGDRQQAERR